MDLLLPALGDYRYVWVGPVATIIFLFAIMYSIVRYRLMDVKMAVARSVSYVLLLIALAVVLRDFCICYLNSGFPAQPDG